MTPEEKLPLIKDLCARLPYGVMVENILTHKIFDLSKYLHCLPAALENFKPYLRPISSMTDEEKIELKSITKGAIKTIGLEDVVVTTDKGFDYLIAHHFDYRGLIPIGLALEAPEGMYKTE